MSKGRGLPMFALAGGLFALIVLLAALQYRWLGQISQSERDRMSATLRDDAAGFAEDFDRELNRAYLLFQLAPASADEDAAAQLSVRLDRWQATSRYPRVVKDVYLATPGKSGVALRRFNPSTRVLEPAEWPSTLAPIHTEIARAEAPPAGRDNTVIRAGVPSIWSDAPALVVSSPLLFVNRVDPRAPDLKLPPEPTYCVLLLDNAYIRTEMLPSLAQHHFKNGSGGVDYQLAVVTTKSRESLYRSSDGFDPAPDAKADASADFFNLRIQDFGPLAAEISRFALFSTVTAVPKGHEKEARSETVIRHTMTGPVGSNMALPPGGALSIVVQKDERSHVTVSDKLVSTGTPAVANARFTVSAAPHWRLLVQHPRGSLDEAVNRARRRNLLVSTGILGILAISVGFLVVSTRRAHDLARQQIEFVATVSHELRTPLAVIRSAADNLADGVVDDEARVRQYGELVRREGVRLTELVEQILEFAGLQSGQRAVSRHPVAMDAVVRDAVGSAQPAAATAGVHIDVAVADGLPAVAGDEPALRRALLNLIGNAVKYGASAGWVGVSARATGGVVEIAVSDRGIGIETAEHDRIFEPFYRTADVVAAQVQGAGLGLSLVKRIIEAHGGRVVVTSAPRQGSTFMVTLPAMRGDATGSESGVEAAAQHS